MSGQPIDRFRFLDGFLKQSPRLLGSIRGKGYRFFPGLEAEAEDLRRQWEDRRDALRQAVQAAADEEELGKFEAAAAPLLRMAERLRKLYVGLASAPFPLAPGEEPIWYDDTDVVAKAQRIPVALFITTERLVIVRTAEGGARNVRDYRLATFKGVAPLPNLEGAVLAFGNERLALGSGNAESWRRLLAKLTAPEFRAEVTVVPEAAEDEGASTAILTPELVAKAMAGSKRLAAPGLPPPTSAPTPPPPEPEPEPVVLLGEPEAAVSPLPLVDATRKMSRPPVSREEPGGAPPAPAEIDAESLLLETPPLPERAAHAEDDGPVSSVRLEELLGDAEPEPPRTEAPPPAPPAPEPPPPVERAATRSTDRGPGGHDVISFDSIFQAAGRQADEQPSPAPPPPSAPSPRPSNEPSPPPEPPVAAAPTARSGMNIALRGLATKEAMRSGNVEAARYVMKGDDAPPPRAAAPAPADRGAARRGDGAGRSKLALIGVIAAVIVIMLLVILFGLGRRKGAAPIDVGGVEEGRTALTPTAQPSAGRPEPTGPAPAPDTEPGILRVVDEEIVATPAGSLSKQTGPLPEVAYAQPPVAPERIPAYDPSVKEYRIHLKDGGEMKVSRYAILSSGLAVPFEDGHVVLPLSKVVRVEPLP